MINLKEVHGKTYRITYDEAYDPSHIPQTHLDKVYMQVPGQWGTIYPHNHTHLAVEVNHHPTATKELKALGLLIHQEGEHEFTFLVPNARFEEIATIIRAKKRRVLSPERRAELRNTGFKKQTQQTLF